MFFPCNDAQTQNSNDNIATAAVIFSPSDNPGIDHSHSPASDLCPPFCTCHCCHVHTIDFGAISFQALNPEISVANTTYLDKVGDEISRSFLDPPRV